ncbi:MAG: TolC family protein [Candidatus Eremiobacteraeota bacterium]|nr:TolC family protein [Candidatus Eremiobacteraeota bacterium]
MKIKYYVIAVIFVFLSFFSFRHAEEPGKYNINSNRKYWISKYAWAESNNGKDSSVPYQHKQMTEEKFNKKNKKTVSPVKKKSTKKSVESRKKKPTSKPTQKIKTKPGAANFILDKTDNEVYNDPIFDSVDIDKILVKPDEFKKEDLIKPPRPTELVPNEILTIGRSVRIAIARNAQLRQGKEKIKQAVAQYKQLKAAKNPTLQLDAAAIKQGPTQEITLPFPFDTKIIFQRDYMYYGQASLRYLITTFGNIENQISASFVNIRITQENYESEEMQVTYNVRASFYNMLKAIAMVGVRKDNVNSTQDHLENANSLYKNGIVSKMDVVRGEYMVSTARQSLISAKKMVILSRSSFLYLLEYDDKIQFRVTPDKMKIPAKLYKLDELQKIGMENRHEILAMNANISASKALLRAAKAQTNPVVSLSSKYTKQTSSSVTNDHSWDVGLSLSIPIFDGGAKSGKIKESESVVRTAEIALDNLKRQIKLEIEQAFLDLRESRINYYTSIKNVQQASVSYHMAKVRYANGLSLSVEMEDALRTLNQARQDLVTAKYDNFTYLAALEKATGKDLEDNN